MLRCPRLIPSHRQALHVIVWPHQAPASSAGCPATHRKQAWLAAALGKARSRLERTAHGCIGAAREPAHACQMAKGDNPHC